MELYIKKFLHACDSTKTKLVNVEMNNVFNSIGYSVTFEFGNIKEITKSKSGREFIWREWSLRIGNAVWRLSKEGKYIIGSEDPQELIQIGIEKLLGKRFQSLQFISQFLDVEFSFDDGYKLTTFFNWFCRDQWTLSLPDNNYMWVDCDNYKEIRKVLNIAKHLPITEKYQEVDFPYEGVKLTKIIFIEGERPKLQFGSKFSIDLKFCEWRLERDDMYLVGYRDLVTSNCNFKNKIYKKIKFYTLMNELIGKTLEKVEVNSFMEGRFQFEDQFVLKTFSCLRSIHQWRIYSKEVPSFYAKIPLAEI